MNYTPGMRVITGGPSCGKTTLIDLFETLGFHVIPEAARDYIEENKRKGISVENLRKDEIKFQHTLVDIKLQREAAAPQDEVVLVDRGMPDGIAYLRYRGLNGEDYFDAFSRGRYTKVFVLDQVPFQSDGIRIENAKDAEEIGRLLYDVYRELGYDVVKVPKLSEDKAMSIINRAEFILNRL